MTTTMTVMWTAYTADEAYKYSSRIDETSSIPRVGEYVYTTLFCDEDKYFDGYRVFEVVRIVHKYVDDMSYIDYTEVVLKGVHP